MPFALILIGLILIVAGVKNTQGQLGNQLVKDFSGPGNFLYWIVAVLVIGAIGYIKEFQTASRLFLALIILALLLSNRGFFTMFSKSLVTGSAKAPQSNSGSSGTPTTGQSNSATSGGAVDVPLMNSGDSILNDTFGNIGL